MSPRRAKRTRNEGHGDFAEGSRLAEVIDRFRERANLHDNSPDDALVIFAHREGRDHTGAEDVRAAWAEWLALMPEPEPEFDEATGDRLTDDELRAMASTNGAGDRIVLREAEDLFDGLLASRTRIAKGEEIIRHPLLCDERESDEITPSPERPEPGPAIVEPAASQSVSDDDETEAKATPETDDCPHKSQTEIGRDRVCDRCGEVVGRAEFPPGEEPPEPEACAHRWRDEAVDPRPAWHSSPVIARRCADCREWATCEDGDHRVTVRTDEAIYCGTCGAHLGTPPPPEDGSIEGYEPPGEVTERDAPSDDIPPDDERPLGGELLF